MITCTADKRLRLMLVFGVLSGILGVMILARHLRRGRWEHHRRDKLRPAGLRSRVITVNNTRGGTAWWALSVSRNSLGA